MSPAKTVCASVWLSQGAEPHRDQTMDQSDPPCQRPGKNGGNKLETKRARREKTRSILKVKFPKLSSLSKKTAKEEDKPPGGWTVEPGASVRRAGERQGAVTDSDAFFFSPTTTSKATDKNKKAKLTVLRTISKMLEENQFIRQRLIALSQAH